MEDVFAKHIVTRVAQILSVPEDALRVAVDAPPDPAMGQYALGLFAAAKTLRRNPAELAAEVASKFNEDELVRRPRAAGPYVNFSVQPPAYFRKALGAIQDEGDSFGRSSLGAQKTVIIEFSSPNIGKPLLVHHLRPTMIGNALCNFYRALGYNVVAINHLGDWGTTFGQLMAAIERYNAADVLKGAEVSALNDLYVRFHDDAKNDPALLDKGREWFRRLEQGAGLAVARPSQAQQMWRRMCELSLAEYQRAYDLLGVKFDSYMGESAYTDMMPDSLRRLREKGLTKISEGATIVDLEPYGMPPCLLLKSDGTTIYATRDIAAAEYRAGAYRFSLMLYVVGAEQRLHFRQLFKVLELMGYDWAKNCVHLDFGLMRMKGVKMSTRRGTVILLEELVHEAIRRVRALIEQKNPALPDKEMIATQVGIGALIFWDLKSKRVKDIDFNWEEALSFEGETGPYLQYTHARLCSILRKYGKPVQREVKFERLSEPEDLQVCRKLWNYPALVRQAAESYEPSILSGYLLDLSASINSYYHKHKVIVEDADLAAARILLVDCARQAIANGLALLGIAAPKEM